MGPKGPSRLKGIETVSFSVVSLLSSPCPKGPSRLKGIETAMTHYMHPHGIPRPKGPSRLKGIETTIVRKVEKSATSVRKDLPV